MEAQNTAFNFQYYCHTGGEKKDAEFVFYLSSSTEDVIGKRQ